jgi:hypothetical protein
LTVEESQSLLGITVIPKPILDRLTLHVSLEMNGKYIFTRRLRPLSRQVERALDYTPFELNGQAVEVRAVMLNRALSALLRSKKQASRK